MQAPRFSSLRLDYRDNHFELRLTPCKDTSGHIKEAASRPGSMRSKVNLNPDEPGDVFVLGRKLDVTPEIRKSVAAAENDFSERKSLTKPQLSQLLATLLPALPIVLPSLLQAQRRTAQLCNAVPSLPSKEACICGFQAFAQALGNNSDQVSLEVLPYQLIAQLPNPAAENAP
jgi:hypothetical protein